MKCYLPEKKNMKVMLVIGLAMIVIGAVFGFLLPEEAHWQTKAAGVINGAGFALTAMAAAVLIRRKRMGEARANDSELAMTDERGMAVAYRAQSVMAIVAVLGIVAIMLVALFRGDELYMIMGVALCFILAFAKLIAWHIYNKKM